MGALTSQPDFPIDFLRPTRISFDTVGNEVDGGVNGVGESTSIETSGGGMWTAMIEGMVLEGPDERYEVISWLGARLNGGFRNIVVPLVNDKIGAFPIIGGSPRPIIKKIRHAPPLKPITAEISWTSAFGVEELLNWDSDLGVQSLEWDNGTDTPIADGALFSDSSGYSQATVYGEVVAMESTGVLRVRVYGGARKVFRWSDFFSIHHPNKGWRLYRSWELLDQTVEENPISRIAIQPPLREAVSVGDRIELARPRCVMKLARGQTVPWAYSGWYSSRPTVNFVEAF